LHRVTATSARFLDARKHSATKTTWLITKELTDTTATNKLNKRPCAGSPPADPIHTAGTCVVLVIGTIALLLDAGLATLHKGPVPLGGQDNGLRAEAVEVVGVGHVLVLATDLRHIVDGSVRILELSVPALTLDGDIVLFLAQRHL